MIQPYELHVTVAEAAETDGLTAESETGADGQMQK